MKRTNGTCEFSSNPKYTEISLGSYILTVKNLTHNLDVTENDYTLMVIAKNASHLVRNSKTSCNCMKLCHLLLGCQCVGKNETRPFGHVMDDAAPFIELFGGNDRFQLRSRVLLFRSTWKYKKYSNSRLLFDDKRWQYCHYCCGSCLPFPRAGNCLQTPLNASKYYSYSLSNFSCTLDLCWSTSQCSHLWEGATNAPMKMQHSRNAPRKSINIADCVVKNCYNK